MKPYHKIQTVYKRDPETKYRTLLEGQFSTPELEFLAENDWSFTEKIDGTNIRIDFTEDGFLSFGGRTDRAMIPALLANRLNEIFLPIQDIMANKFPKGVTLYGEGYGAGIQKGGENYSLKQDFILFDVLIDNTWLNRVSVGEISLDLGLVSVPLLATGTLSEMVEHARDGIRSTFGDFQAEGIVARPACEITARNGDRIITKIKCKDFN